MTPQVIDSFTGEYRWLSNFSEHPFTVDGVVYLTAEHFYQSRKTINEMERFAVIEQPTPGRAKREGKKVTLRTDWDIVRNQVMRNAVFHKFEAHPDLQQKLIDPKATELIEGNTGGDTYWGICDGVGENQLGHTLMLLRTNYIVKALSDEFAASASSQ